LSLLNPPLILAAAAEALAGAYVAGLEFSAPAPYVLAAAAALLFAAGGVFSAYFDRIAASARNPFATRPEGETPVGVLWRVGWTALLLGTALPALVGRPSVLAAIGVALLVVLYAAVTREIWGAGFLTQGAARGANFTMGLTAYPEVVGQLGAAAIPVALFAVALAVARHSRQPGAPPTTSFVAVVHAVAALSVLLFLGAGEFYYRLDALPFLFGTLVLTLPRLVKLVQDPRRPAAVEALQYGFLALTVGEATLAAGYAGFRAGFLVVLFCVPLVLALKRWPVRLVVTPR
jgi:hypothetical protein